MLERESASAARKLSSATLPERVRRPKGKEELEPAVDKVFFVDAPVPRAVLRCLSDAEKEQLVGRRVGADIDCVQARFEAVSLYFNHVPPPRDVKHKLAESSLSASGDPGAAVVRF